MKTLDLVVAITFCFVRDKTFRVTKLCLELDQRGTRFGRDVDGTFLEFENCNSFVLFSRSPEDETRRERVSPFSFTELLSC